MITRVYAPDWNTDFITQLPDNPVRAHGRERVAQVILITDPDKRVCRNESIKGRARYRRMLAKQAGVK